jgi:hypothetical protein
MEILSRLVSKQVLFKTSLLPLNWNSLKCFIHSWIFNQSILTTYLADLEVTKAVDGFSEVRTPNDA